MAITIVSVYLLAVGIILTAICFVGSKKTGVDQDEE